MSHVRLLLLLSLLNLLACKNKAPPATLPPNFEDHYRIESHFDAANQDLSVKLSLDPGFHAYAAREKTGKPLRLEISSLGGWQALGPLALPRGQLKKLAGLGESDVLTGTININQKLLPGPKIGKAIFHMQICTDTLCDRPRIHEISLTIYPHH